MVDLPALRLSDRFSKPHRTLNTTIADRSLFQQYYNNTNLNTNGLNNLENKNISCENFIKMHRECINNINDNSYCNLYLDKFENCINNLKNKNNIY